MELFEFSLLFAQQSTDSISPAAEIVSGHDIIAIIAIGAPMALAALGLIFYCLGRAGRCLVDASLKHRMLRLGYSAADIERVLQADKTKPSSDATIKGKSDIVVAETLKPVVR